MAKSEVFRIISSYKKRLNLRHLARTALTSLAVFILGLHLYYIIWKQLEPSSGLLFYSNIAIRSILVLLLIYLLVSAVQKLFDRIQTARYLDKISPEADDLFQNTLELQIKSTDESVLEALVQLSEERLQQRRYQLPPLLSSNLLMAFLSLYCGIAAIWIMDFSHFTRAFLQFYSNKAEELVLKEQIDLSPGSTKLPRNSQLLIRVLNPEKRLSHRLFYRTEVNWRELALSDYTYLFERLENTIEYYVEHSLGRSPVYRVEVVDEPIVRSWLVHYEFPGYTGLGSALDSLSYGNISAYAGSRVKLAIRTNVAIVSATIRYSDGKSQALSRLDSHNWTSQFIVSDNKNWYIELIDELGRKSRPEEKQITIIPDNPPQIRILFPGRDITLNQDLSLPLIISADDDFGLRDCSLKYQVDSGLQSTQLIQSIIPGKLFNRDFVFNLRDLDLVPGSTVSYWVEVYDNSPHDQKAESTIYRARFPSMEEIFREMEQRERRNTEDLQNVTDRSRELQDDFERLRRELLRQDNPEWRQQQQLQQIIQEQQNLSEQVEDINQSFQNMLERMQSNTVLSPEMMQKMQRIQSLMEEINNENLQQALQRMQNAMENLSMDELRRAMENFRFSMEDFEQKLQQTLDLLESVRLEQSVQKALQIAQEMERMQESLNQRSQNPGEDSQRLASDQQNIAQKYQNLQDELQATRQMMDQQRDRAAAQQLEQIQTEMQNSQLNQDLNESQQNLRNNNRPQAANAQSQALRKMRQFSRRLQEMRDSMSAGSQQAVMQALETAIRELLVFSRNHELSASKYQNDPYLIVQELISNYEGIQLSLNKLYSNPMVMMFLPPKFFMDLNITNTAYREFFVGIGEMQYSRIPELLSTMQRGINLMIYDLMQAMKNQGTGSGSGSGMQSLMQMLQQMGQEQLAMNMLTQQLLQQMQAQGMSPAMQQQMQRLANEEQRLADNLKRALQNNPQAQQQGNTIQQIIEEAEAISRQLRAGQLNQELLARQERIISRMLDAQRSLNQREQSRERRAESSQRQEWESRGAPIDFETLRRRALLDDSYRSYPREYQQLIIEYLKRVNRATP